MILVDARSAASQRTTGWERYARELASVLVRAPGVAVRTGRAASALGRVRGDLVDLPLAGRGADLEHFLSYPPAAPRPDRTITTLHDLTWWTRPETASRGGRLYYRRLADRAVRRSTVVTVSESGARAMEEFFGVPVHVVHPVVRTRPRSEVVVETRDRPYLLFVGSIEPRKNLARLVEAFRRSALRDDVDLVLAGRRAWGELPPGVEHIDTPSDARLRGLVAGAAALVLPSLDEGFGLPVVEAQALGTPVLCSDLPVLREISGEAATFFDPLDVDAIRAALDGLGERAPDPEAGRRNSSRFSAAHTADQLRALYGSLGVEVDL